MPLEHPELCSPPVAHPGRCPEDDTKVGIAVANGASDASANFGVIDRLGRMGPLVIDRVPGGLHEADEMLFEFISSVIGADCDSCHQ